MIQQTLALLAVACSLLALSACRAVALEDLSPEQFAARERVVYLVSKAAGARIVAEGAADAADLARAASIVEAAAGQDVPGALLAAGLLEPEWELLGLLVQQELEPWQLDPLLPRMVAAAARGLREGALGISEPERDELREQPAPPGSR